MNSLLYDKKTAYISVVLMVLVSIFLLGGNSLRREYNRVVDVFRGQNELGIDTQQESIIVLTNAFNLLVIADRYLEDDIQAEGLRNVFINAEGLRNVLDTAQVRRNHLLDSDRLNWEAQFITADKVRPYMRSLLTALSHEEISGSSAGHLTEIEGNINGAFRRMALSGALDEAGDFNRLLQSPYTALIATVRGIREFPVPVTGLD